MYLAAKKLCKIKNMDMECRYLYVSRYAMRQPEYHLLRERCVDHICVGGIDVTTERIMAFDIFDTLIFRPFSESTDLFYFVGEKLEYMDFKRIRMEAELEARQKKFQMSKTYELTLAEIWQVLEEKTGLSAENR